MTSNQIAYWVNEEKKRSNLAMELETQRHNLEQEKIGRQQAAASLLGAQASMYNASVNAGNLAELKRHNLASESISSYTAETGRLGTVVSNLVGVRDSNTKRYDAETRRKSYELDVKMKPYTAVESVTKSIGNLVSGASSIAKYLLESGGN